MRRADFRIIPSAYFEGAEVNCLSYAQDSPLAIETATPGVRRKSQGGFNITRWGKKRDDPITVPCCSECILMRWKRRGTRRSCCVRPGRPLLPPPLTLIYLTSDQNGNPHQRVHLLDAWRTDRFKFPLGFQAYRKELIKGINTRKNQKFFHDCFLDLLKLNSELRYDDFRVRISINVGRAGTKVVDTKLEGFGGEPRKLWRGPEGIFVFAFRVQMPRSEVSFEVEMRIPLKEEELPEEKLPTVEKLPPAEESPMAETLPTLEKSPTEKEGLSLYYRGLSNKDPGLVKAYNQWAKRIRNRLSDEEPEGPYDPEWRLSPDIHHKIAQSARHNRLRFAIINLIQRWRT